MAICTLRFDFRNPEFAQTTMGERYRTALEMSEWAERLGFISVGLSEHHGSDDGYLPSPMTLAAAIAARTKTIMIGINAVVAPFHNPLRLAEDAAVVDQLSNGRFMLTITNGYVASEFDMFGVPIKDRAKCTTEAVETLRKAWTGEPFEFRGRTARITPRPASERGPMIMMGGSSEPAARRAARLGDGFLASTPEVWDFYRDECVKVGKPDPGPHPGGDTSFFHLSHDPDKAWELVAPYAMHETNAYGKWMVEAGTVDTGGYKPFEDAEALRASGQYRTLTPEQMVDEVRAKGPHALLIFHPMMGGIPPALAWDSLRLFEHEVLPKL